MRTALVVDFDSKKVINRESNEKVDLYVIDRLKNKIVGVIKNDQEINLDKDMDLVEFYHFIGNNYDQIFSLFVSLNYSQIDEYIKGSTYNKERMDAEAKVYTYLLNYVMNNKLEALNYIIELLNNDYSIKDILIRIHNYRKKEAFSIQDLINKYISCLY